MNKKIIVSLLIALTLISGKSFAFRFAVMGDSRGGENIHESILKIAKQWKAQVVINTGDLVTHPGNRDEWKVFNNIAATLDVPYLLVVGNHDVNSTKSEQVWKEEVNLPGNELYYSYEKDGVLLVVLDTLIPGEEKKIVGKQLEWLKKTLDPDKYKHQFVFLHHPVFMLPEFKHYGHSLDEYPELRDAFHKLMLDKKVEAVIAGHEHTYHRMMKNGIWYIISGGGGATLYSGFCHVIIIDVDGDRTKAKVIDWHGTTKSDFMIK